MSTVQYTPGLNITTLKPGDVLDLGAAGQFSKTAQGGFSPVTSQPATSGGSNPPASSPSPFITPTAPQSILPASSSSSGVVTSAGATQPPASQPAAPGAPASGPNVSLLGSFLGTTAPPTPPSMEAILGASDIPTMQNNLATIQSTQAQLQAAYTSYILQLNGEGTPQGIVDVMTDEKTKGMQIQMDSLNASAQLASTNLSNAMTWVNTIMTAQQADYTNATQAYNDAFSRAYQFQTTYNSAATTQQNNASAYLSSVSSLISSGGVNWNSIDPAMKATIQSMEAQAGWPAGTLETFAKQKPGSNIVGTTTTVNNNGLAQQNIVSQNRDGSYSIVTVQLPGTIPSVFGAGNFNPNASGTGNGYNGSILQGTNLSPTTPLSTVLTDPASTQTLFEAMAAAEGGPSASGAQANNPLDLKYVQGMQGATDSGIKAEDGGTFAAFPSVADAQKAYAAELSSPQYQGLTLDQALQKWSGYTSPQQSQAAATSYINPSSGEYTGPSIANGNTPQEITSALMSGPSFVHAGATYDQPTLYNAAITSMLGGANTTTGGMSSAPGKAAIANKQAAIMAAYGINQFQVTAAQTEFQGLSSANVSLVGQDAYIKTYTGTATDALNLALQNYGAVGNTPVKFVNNYKNWVAGNFTPSGPLAALQTNIYTAAREYAKVTGGGAASSQALTDTASNAVDELLNAAQTPQQFQATVTQMQNDMAITNQNFDKQISSFAPSIAGIYQQMNPSSSGSGSSSSSPTSITVGGQSYNVGSTINVSGTSYLINADGTVTPQ